MEKQVKNKIDLNVQNNMPAGSFVIKDGKLLPNLDDEAMRGKDKVQEQEQEEKKIKKDK